MCHLTLWFDGIMMCKGWLDQQRHPKNRISFHWRCPIKNFNWLKAITSVERGLVVEVIVLSKTLEVSWCAKAIWIGSDISKIEYQSNDIVQWNFSTDLKQSPQSNVEVNLSSDTLIWWSELWCATDDLICRDILKIEHHSEYYPLIL